MARYLFTSESVSEGHPDKLCDQISDAIVDLYLESDPEARVAVEALATTNRVVLAGEVRGGGDIGQQLLIQKAREVIRDVGYEQDGFHWQKAVIDSYVHEQSVDIAVGVDATQGKDDGAGDQGLMFGYACCETPELMPAPIRYAHAILQQLSQARRVGSLPMLGPDAKSQITVCYEAGKAVGVSSIVVSSQHHQSVSQEQVREWIRPHVVAALPQGWMCQESAFLVNPTGRFVIGGPDGDTGLTGRKIIVDTYGGAAPHGGGAFSGKDPTKVDRSGAYVARYLAKNVVAAGLAERCTIQLAYAIGVSDPLSFYASTHGTGLVDEEKLTQILPQLVDLTPRGIRQHLGLNRPIYRQTAAYGHFGRQPGADGSFSWERVDLVEILRSALG